MIRRKKSSPLEVLANEHLKTVVELKDYKDSYLKARRKLSEIEESINYAKNIQFAMLPDSAIMNSFCKEHFTYFRPKNEVSGDFFWYHLNKNGLYIISADCTGHGIPGGFLSMLGMNILTRILNEGKIHDPGEILTEIHQTLCSNLNQSSSANKDSIDMGICRYNLTDNVVEFAGAKTDLMYFESGEGKYIKGNRYSAGCLYELKHKTFDTFCIDASTQKNYYLSTDGIRDQFGGSNFKKLKAKGLFSIIEKIQSKPLNIQHQLIQLHLEQWMINTEQVDDMLLIGFQL